MKCIVTLLCDAIFLCNGDVIYRLTKGKAKMKNSKTIKKKFFFFLTGEEIRRRHGNRLPFGGYLTNEGEEENW